MKKRENRFSRVGKMSKVIALKSIIKPAIGIKKDIFAVPILAKISQDIREFIPESKYLCVGPLFAWIRRAKCFFYRKREPYSLGYLNHI